MKQCLVVDDSSVIRKVARRILESSGWEIREAENGQEALERCRDRMPDAILLDWQIPVTCAAEFLVALRMMPRGSEPVVVYCTTENDPMDIYKQLSSGADDFILKPFDRMSLKDKFDPLLRAA